MLTKERDADEAEREIEDLKSKFMKIWGQMFRVLFQSNIFGIFVVLDNTVEGLVRLSNIEDDYYIYNEKQYSLIGERTRKTYRIGDEVKVQLTRADIMTRQIDFIIIEDDDEVHFKPLKNKENYNIKHPGKINSTKRRNQVKENLEFEQ